MTDAELKERLASTDKLQAELHKLLVESHKLVADMVHTKKKNRWLEFSLMLAVFAAGIAFAKLFM